jgi:hypothetical protein
MSSPAKAGDPVLRSQPAMARPCPTPAPGLLGPLAPMVARPVKPGDDSVKASRFRASTAAVVRPCLTALRLPRSASHGLLDCDWDCMGLFLGFGLHGVIPRISDCMGLFRRFGLHGVIPRNSPLLGAATSTQLGEAQPNVRDSRFAWFRSSTRQNSLFMCGSSSRDDTFGRHCPTRVAAIVPRERRCARSRFCRSGLLSRSSRPGAVDNLRSVLSAAAKARARSARCLGQVKNVRVRHGRRNGARRVRPRTRDLITESGSDGASNFVADDSSLCLLSVSRREGPGSGDERSRRR